MIQKQFTIIFIVYFDRQQNGSLDGVLQYWDVVIFIFSNMAAVVSSNRIHLAGC